MGVTPRSVDGNVARGAIPTLDVDFQHDDECERRPSARVGHQLSSLLHCKSRRAEVSAGFRASPSCPPLCDFSPRTRFTAPALLGRTASPA